ncbi:MAG: NAD(P)H-dependent oxidoreductase [Pseudomonadota bacterium]
MTNTLLIQSSARGADSVTRRLAADVAARLGGTLTTRDLSDGIPFVSEAWVGATFTPPDARTAEQTDALALSDSLVAELQAADTLIIGMPIYNFGVPAALKAWMDQVARAGLTFKYTETGAVGLLEGKRAVIVAASGGVPSGSPADFATTHLTFFLGFLGIKDVTLIAADQTMTNASAVAEAEAKIAALAA